MLSSDRSEHRADHRRRPAARVHGDACKDRCWDDDAQSFDPNAPWDDESAEVLTCLFESEEGRLWRPAAVDRARPSLSPAGNAPEAGEGIDRAWLEAHLSGLAERLHQALAQANPEATLAALSGRLETIEQRFGATLGRVAQRADLDGLGAIESRVLDVAQKLEEARERLERINAVDEEVRALTRKVDEAVAQRASGLEKLVRDCMVEWREGEQRTASALQHIEEAIGRLGEIVEAIEATKPAAELSVPPLTGSELRPAPGASDAFASAPALYRSVLEAADYVPKQSFAEQPAFRPASTGADESERGSLLDFSTPSGGEGGPAEARLTPRLTLGALRIMALRAKLRQSNGSSRGNAPSQVPLRGEIKRAGLSILLMAGAALVASSTFYLYQIFFVAVATGQ